MTQNVYKHLIPQLTRFALAGVGHSLDPEKRKMVLNRIGLPILFDLVLPKNILPLLSQFVAAPKNNKFLRNLKLLKNFY